MMSNKILAGIKAHERELVAIRRDIHAHPETGFEEVRTSALVAQKLLDWGIETHVGIAGTGVVGTLKGRQSGQRAIALRADMDALHIEERTGLPHQSTVPGKMHACGHDGHTTMLLGAARYLAGNPDFAGTVHFIFQPAEEGQGGAAAMVDEGLFERFPVDAVYGMHNQPGRSVGWFGLRSGAMKAGADNWTVTFGGTGGHGGAKPHLATDPTIVQAHFVLAAQNIIGRNVPPLESAVISVGHIAAGAIGSPNIIPTEVIVAGTARTFSPATRSVLEGRLREVAEGLAAIQGCSCQFAYERATPPLFCALEQTAIMAAVAVAMVGEEMVNTSIPLTMGGEDFAFMAEQRPSSMIMIGNGVNADDASFANLHTPVYDFNDDILCLGATYWVNLVHAELA